MFDTLLKNWGETIIISFIDRKNIAKFGSFIGLYLECVVVIEAVV